MLVIDEAHLLAADQLEELRLLSNAEHGLKPARSPALLVGQPTLRRRIKLGTFAALDQRIALRYTMTGMQLPRDQKLSSPTTSDSPDAPTPCSPTTRSP